MTEHTFHLRSLLIGPVLCMAVLLGIALENRTYRVENDFDPFHVRAARAINELPPVLGAWMGKERLLPEEERALLQPNAYRCIELTDTRAAALSDPSRTVLLLLAQVNRARKMDGHFPPKCYPSRGYELVAEKTRDWAVGDGVVRGMEYQFERREGSRVSRTTVYNFMVLPGQGICRDMKAITLSAEDYQQRYYGAAQFQVVFASSLADPAATAARDAVFAELIAPCRGVIATLSDGALEYE
ncbi:MAG TPA: hypothetical protein VF624_09980 [Tepidisphaeraceae bacterium]|jgi:hypothetical protein